MNKYRRRILTRVTENLENIKCTVEEVKDEEEQSYENLPESLMCSEKGSSMMDNVEYLNDAVSNIDDAINNINDAINNGG